MSLHVDHYEYAGTGNSGAPLLLIHGWAMHGGMWGNAAEQLAQHFRVMAVDLPGHGHSVNHQSVKQQGVGGGEQSQACPLNLEPSHFALDSIVDELSAQFDGPLAVCGWSLGGQIALRWAMRHPGQVSRLVTVASTPSFVRRTGWDHALSVEILQEFADDLRHRYALTLRRFLALQMRGSEQEREWLTVLRDALFSRGEPDPAALQSGLDILRGCDLCGVLPEVDQPVLVLAGERDALIPVQAAQYMAGRIPNGRLAVIDGAGHAPFLSHPGEFARHVIDFLNEE
jgi:pimeloyl-[acyl-carrier protein] methyl ester esterase